MAKLRQPTTESNAAEVNGGDKPAGDREDDLEARGQCSLSRRRQFDDDRQGGHDRRRQANANDAAATVLARDFLYGFLPLRLRPYCKRSKVSGVGRLLRHDAEFGPRKSGWQ
jgi:hypothetical protein